VGHGPRSLHGNWLQSLRDLHARPLASTPRGRTRACRPRQPPPVPLLWVDNAGAPAAGAPQACRTLGTLRAALRAGAPAFA